MGTNDQEISAVFSRSCAGLEEIHSRFPPSRSIWVAYQSDYGSRDGQRISWFNSRVFHEIFHVL